MAKSTRCPTFTVLSSAGGIAVNAIVIAGQLSAAIGPCLIVTLAALGSIAVTTLLPRPTYTAPFLGMPCMEALDCADAVVVVRPARTANANRVFFIAYSFAAVGLGSKGEGNAGSAAAAGTLPAVPASRATVR